MGLIHPTTGSLCIARLTEQQLIDVKAIPKPQRFFRRGQKQDTPPIALFSVNWMRCASQCVDHMIKVALNCLIKLEFERNRASGLHVSGKRRMREEQMSEAFEMLEMKLDETASQVIYNALVLNLLINNSQ
jgi:hypothetical protein